MSEPGSRRGRAHDAERAREAILNAAEEIFAEHGFDGARIDAIAATAGYNKSLIFQYFGDKLNLYTEVLRRADKELNELQKHVFAPLLADESIASDARRFRASLKIIVQTLFDYLVEHPRLTRMVLWEMAEGWQTFAKIASKFPPEDTEQLEAFFDKARRAGLMRSGFDPIVQLTMIIQICQSYLAYLPVYQMVLPGENFSSTAALARAREYIVAFIIAGIMVDPPETKT